MPKNRIVRKVKRKNFFWDFDEASVRGSFVNLLITVTYLVLIVLSCLFRVVAINVRDIAPFLIGFFGISISVWAGKKAFEYSKMNGMNSYSGMGGMGSMYGGSMGMGSMYSGDPTRRNVEHNGLDQPKLPIPPTINK